MFCVCFSLRTLGDLPEELELEQAFYVFFVRGFQIRFCLKRGFCSLQNKTEQKSWMLTVCSCAPPCGILPSVTWPTRHGLLIHAVTAFPQLLLLSLSPHGFPLAHTPSRLSQAFLRFPQNPRGTFWSLIFGIMLLRRPVYQYACNYLFIRKNGAGHDHSHGGGTFTSLDSLHKEWSWIFFPLLIFVQWTLFF